MKILIETLLLTFMVFINFCELSASRPDCEANWSFGFEGKMVEVWQLPNSPVVHMELQGGNNFPTRLETVTHFATKYMAYKLGVYFIVHTKVEYGVIQIVAVENAERYNNHPREDVTAFTSMFLSNGRTVYVFRNGIGQVHRMCTSPTNIIPTVDECNDYQIKGYLKYKNRMVYTAFELKGEHLLGVEFQGMQETRRRYLWF